MLSLKIHLLKELVTLVFILYHMWIRNQTNLKLRNNTIIYVSFSTNDFFKMKCKIYGGKQGGKITDLEHVETLTWTTRLKGFSIKVLACQISC